MYVEGSSCTSVFLIMSGIHFGQLTHTNKDITMTSSPYSPHKECVCYGLHAC